MLPHSACKCCSSRLQVKKQTLFGQNVRKKSTTTCLDALSSLKWNFARILRLSCWPFFLYLVHFSQNIFLTVSHPHTSSTFEICLIRLKFLSHSPFEMLLARHNQSDSFFARSLPPFERSSIFSLHSSRFVYEREHWLANWLAKWPIDYGHLNAGCF